MKLFSPSILSSALSSVITVAGLLMLTSLTVTTEPFEAYMPIPVSNCPSPSRVTLPFTVIVPVADGSI